MMMALEAAASSSSQQQQQQGSGFGNGSSPSSESLLANVLVGNSGPLHTTTTTTSKASSSSSLGKGVAKSKKKTQSKSSKQQHHVASSSNNNVGSSSSSSSDLIRERKDEEIYLENFIKSIEYLPTEIRKDLGTIKELDKKTSKNVTLSTELASDSSKSNADRSEAIRKLMDESVNLCLEKVDISQRSLNKLNLHMEDLEKKIEELSQNIQQKPQNTLKLESLYIPQLSEDNQVHYFTPSDSSLQSSSSKSNKRLVQHSENLKTLKSGSLKSYPEKEMHAHVFNHTPEQEGIVRGNSTTTRSYTSNNSSSSSSSTKKAAEKEPPSQITVKTSTGSVISVPNDRIGNSDTTLVSISSEQKIKKQKKTSQPKPETAPVNLTPLSIITTNTSSNGSIRKEKSSTSSVPKENTISSEISSIKIPKKDSSSSSSSASSNNNNTQSATQSSSSTKKSRSTASSSSSIGSSSSSSSSVSTPAATTSTPSSTSSEQSKSGKKRKVIASSTSNSGKTKKQKQSATNIPVTPVIDQPIIPTSASLDENTLIYEENLQDPTPYCYCKKTMAEDSSEMVGCDAPQCPNNGWIHKHCLHPGEDPDAPKFYCLNCSKTMNNKKKKKK